MKKNRVNEFTENVKIISGLIKGISKNTLYKQHWEKVNYSALMK